MFFAQVTSEADVEQAIKLANKKFGCLTIAVNCAGIGIAVKTVSKKGTHPLDQFERVLKVSTQHWPTALNSTWEKISGEQCRTKCSCCKLTSN